MNMKGMGLVTGFLLALLLPAAATSAATVEVNAGRQVGHLPYLFRAGMFAFGSETAYPAYLEKKFFQDLKPGAIEVSAVQYLYWSMSFSDFVQKLQSNPKYDAFLHRIEASGGKVVVSIFGMPQWLSTKPSDAAPVEPGEWMAVWGASPPKDYEKWAEVVQAIVNYYSNKLGLDALYKVWWEPDGSRWQGTEEEFFKLYKYTVIGARRANKSAKVGGPSASGWEDVFWRNRGQQNVRSMLHNFIQYCGRTPFPELGLNRIPIDFLVWHQFDSNPIGGFQTATTEVKSWLRTSGYRETTPILIGEWTTWLNFPNSHSPEHDTAYEASYVIAALIGMDRAGITYHSFTSIVEQAPQSFQGEFGGDFGIFTKSLIIKPVYNGFRTLSFLGETRLEVAHDDPFLAAVGTSDKRGVTLLIANYVPDGKVLQGAARSMWQGKAHTKEELARYGVTREKLGQILREFKERGKVDLRGLHLPDGVKRDIQEIEAFAQTAARRSKEAVEVHVLLKNLPPDLTQYERYLIDATHSNSYAVRSRIEAALAAGPKEAREQAERFLLQRGRSIDEIKRLEDQLRRRDPRLKEQADPDARAAHALYRDQLATVINRINEWPEVALQKVQEKNLRQSGEYRETLQIPPYSVTLIILSR
jgi:hypothetical protein